MQNNTLHYLKKADKNSNIINNDPYSVNKNLNRNDTERKKKAHTKHQIPLNKIFFILMKTPFTQETFPH